MCEKMLQAFVKETYRNQLIMGVILGFTLYKVCKLEDEIQKLKEGTNDE